MRYRYEKKGITLTELLAIIVIIGIILSIAFVLVGDLIDKTKKETLERNIMNIYTTILNHEYKLHSGTCTLYSKTDDACSLTTSSFYLDNEFLEELGIREITIDNSINLTIIIDTLDNSYVISNHQIIE